MQITGEVYTLVLMYTIIIGAGVVGIMFPPMPKKSLYENLWDEKLELDTIVHTSDKPLSSDELERIDILMQLHYERMEQENRM